MPGMLSMFRCCYAGVLGGAVYVNAFTLLAKEVEPSLREFSMSTASLADSVGIALADLCGILVQARLRLEVSSSLICLHPFRSVM